MRSTQALAAGLLLCALAACTDAQVTGATTTTSKAIADGQLACAIGPTIVGLIDPSGAALINADAQRACALVNGVSVTPPAPGSTVPTITIDPSVLVAKPNT
jgi:hypothetical protein